MTVYDSQRRGKRGGMGCHYFCRIMSTMKLIAGF